MRFIITVAFGSWFFCFNSEASDIQCLNNNLTSQFIFSSDNTVIKQKTNMNSQPEIGTWVPVTDNIDLIIWENKATTIIHCSDFTICQ